MDTNEAYSTLPDTEKQRIESAFWRDSGADVLAELEDSARASEPEAAMRWKALQNAWRRVRDSGCREYLSRQPRANHLLRTA